MKLTVVLLLLVATAAASSDQAIDLQAASARSTFTEDEKMDLLTRFLEGGLDPCCETCYDNATDRRGWCTFAWTDCGMFAEPLIDDLTTECDAFYCYCCLPIVW